MLLQFKNLRVPQGLEVLGRCWFAVFRFEHRDAELSNARYEVVAACHQSTCVLGSLQTFPHCFGLFKHPGLRPQLQFVGFEQLSLRL